MNKKVNIRTIALDQLIILNVHAYVALCELQEFFSDEAKNIDDVQELKLSENFVLGFLDPEGLILFCKSPMLMWRFDKRILKWVQI